MFAGCVGRGAVLTVVGGLMVGGLTVLELVVVMALVVCLRWENRKITNLQTVLVSTDTGELPVPAKGRAARERYRLLHRYMYHDRAQGFAQALDGTKPCLPPGKGKERTVRTSRAQKRSKG